MHSYALHLHTKIQPEGKTHKMILLGIHKIVTSTSVLPWIPQRRCCAENDAIGGSTQIFERKVFFFVVIDPRPIFWATSECAEFNELPRSPSNGIGLHIEGSKSPFLAHLANLAKPEMCSQNRKCSQNWKLSALPHQITQISQVAKVIAKLVLGKKQAKTKYPNPNFFVYKYWVLNVFAFHQDVHALLFIESNKNKLSFQVVVPDICVKTNKSMKQ